MVSVAGASWTILSIIILARSSFGLHEWLEHIEKNCTRSCDSHFQGAECWQKTYEYFINHLMQSLVQYANAVENSNERINATETLLRVYGEYVRENEDLKDLLTNVLTKIDFEQMVLEAAGSIKIDHAPDNRYNLHCPEKCNRDSLVGLISLSGLAIGLTIGTLAFVIAYVLVSKFQYKKLDNRNALARKESQRQ